MLTTALLTPEIAALLVLAKLLLESITVWDRSISARLQRGPLRAAVATRDVIAFAAALLLIAAPLTVALPVLFAGELMERYLYFRAVDAPKMPGQPA